MAQANRILNRPDVADILGGPQWPHVEHLRYNFMRRKRREIEEIITATNIASKRRKDYASPLANALLSTISNIFLAPLSFL